MSHSLYVTATEAMAGKSTICLGLMEMLLSKVGRVGFFRPLINVEPDPHPKGKDDSGPRTPHSALSPAMDHHGKEKDNDIDLMATRFDLKIPYAMMYGYTTKEASHLVSLGKEEEAVEGIIKKFNELKEKCDFVLCEGTDFAGSTAAFELDFNAEISNHLGSPVLLLASAHQKTVGETIHSIELAIESLSVKGCQTIAIIVNRVHPEHREAIAQRLREGGLTRNQLVYTLPEVPYLGKPTVGEIARILGAEVLYGKEQLHRHAHNFIVAAMQLRNFLERIEKGSLIITPGDRADIIVACLAIVSSTSMETIAGILLTGGLVPEESIWKLIKGFPAMVPILSVKENTYPTATVVDKIHATITPDNDRKITTALSVFEKNIRVMELGERIITTRTTMVTPKMFEYELIQKARLNKQHIVLPEGEEERILRAAETLLRREVVDITLLGNEQVIRQRISQLELNLDQVAIIDPLKSARMDDYVETYYQLRRHRGITKDNAHDIMCDVSFFGTMMVYKGHADGMVSGSVHSTAHTIRPAFEFIKTKPGFSIVSSVFFMCLTDRVLVYGDCAVNPDPNAEQLAEIALNSAHTAKTFGIEPVVAMLSYSTGESGKGEDVEKVRRATIIAKEKAKVSFPGLKLEGPIQYDAAVDREVARTKMPESEVAGRATVFIFPDLNTGNNTYKAVQRSARAVAVGPMLQGLKRPVNDLSRGCTIPDIVNTVAITAIQSQAEKGLV